MKEIIEVINPILISRITKAMKSAGVTDKQVIKAITNTQKQIIAKELIKKIQTNTDKIIAKIRKDLL